MTRNSDKLAQAKMAALLRLLLLFVSRYPARILFLDFIFLEVIADLEQWTVFSRIAPRGFCLRHVVIYNDYNDIKIFDVRDQRSCNGALI